MMLWIKIGIVVAAMLGALGYDLYRDNVRQKAMEAAKIESHNAAVAKMQAEEVRRALEEKEAEAKEVEQRHKKALRALMERERADQQTIEHVNRLMDEIQVLRSENEELRIWSMQYHPITVTGLLNAAHTGDGSKAGSSDEAGLRLAPSDFSPVMPDRGVSGTN